MSLLGRLYLLVFLAVLPALGILVYNQIELRRANEAEIVEEARRLLSLIEAEQARVVEGVRQVLATAAESAALRNGDVAGCQDMMRRLAFRLPHWESIRATDADGTILCSSEPSAVGVEIGERAHFREAMSTGRFAIGEYVLRQPLGDAVLPFALPYEDVQGRRAGVVAMTLSLEWLETYLAGKRLPEGATLTVADRNGIILARLPDGRAWAGWVLPPEVLPLLESGRSGIARVTEFDTVPRVLAYSTVAGADNRIFLSVGLDARAALRAVDAATTRGVALIGLGLLGALLAAGFGGRHVLRRPLETLVAAAGRWRAGDYAARADVRSSAPEIRQLGDAFNAMAAALQAREQAQEEANALARKMATVLASTTDGVFEVDHQWRIVFVNDRARAMAAGKDILGLTLWETAPGLLGIEAETTLRAAMAAQSPAEYEIFNDALDSWFQVRVFPSPAGLVLYVQDTTERKRAAERSAAQEARYQAIVDTAVDAIVVIGPGGLVESVNPAAEAIFGYAAAEVVGRPADLLIPEGWPHPEIRASGAAMTELEVEGRRRDGSTFPVELSLAAWQAGGQRHWTAILRDISERKGAEQLLREARDAAVAANRAKSQFLASMSHELRTPLNSIIGFSEMIEQQIAGPIGNERYGSYASDIRRSGLHLLGLINDILDFSKLDADRLVLHDETIDVRAILADAVRMVKVRAAKAGVAFAFSVDGAVRSCRGDELRLRQVLLNLLSNAVKFTPAGGTVEIQARIGAEGELVLAIRDTGIGIAAEDLQKVFEPFSQVGDVYVRHAEGTGLGLSIARRLVELHQGTLTLESVVGQGTTVTVTLPKERVVDCAFAA